MDIYGVKPYISHTVSGENVSAVPKGTAGAFVTSNVA